MGAAGSNAGLATTNKAVYRHGHRERHGGNKMTHPRKLTAAVALALLAAPFSPARAQTAEEKKPEDEKQHLGTISVTAERVTGFKARTTQVGAFRDAEILDVPATVNVIPRT